MSSALFCTFTTLKALISTESRFLQRHNQRRPVKADLLRVLITRTKEQCLTNANYLPNNLPNHNCTLITRLFCFLEEQPITGPHFHLPHLPSWPCVFQPLSASFRPHDTLLVEQWDNQPGTKSSIPLPSLIPRPLTSIISGLYWQIGLLSSTCVFIWPRTWYRKVTRFN